MSRAQAIRGAVEVSSKILDCADVGTCGMLSVITALEFFQHYFAKMGHRNTSCDPHLHQAIEQPMLPTSREASAAGRLRPNALVAIDGPTPGLSTTLPNRVTSE